MRRNSETGNAGITMHLRSPSEASQKRPNVPPDQVSAAWSKKRRVDTVYEGFADQFTAPVLTTPISDRRLCKWPRPAHSAEIESSVGYLGSYERCRACRFSEDLWWVNSLLDRIIAVFVCMNPFLRRGERIARRIRCRTRLFLRREGGRFNPGSVSLRSS